MTTTPFPKTYETLEAEIRNEHIVHLKFNRPKTLNAMSIKFFEELSQFFEDLKSVPARVVVVSGNGKHFSSGLDLNDAMSNILTDDDTETDTARKAIKLMHIIEKLQNSISAADKSSVPVIAAVSGYCIGGAIDFISACDIRLCDATSKFTIKEIDIGMAADIGTLQRLPFIIGNDSFLREIAYTGRIFEGEEALKQGLVSQVFKSKEELLENAFKLAQTIADKSPVGIWGIKKTLNKNRDQIIQNGLEYIKILNMSLLKTDDMSKAVQAGFKKTTPIFPKL